MDAGPTPLFSEWAAKIVAWLTPGSPAHESKKATCPGVGFSLALIR